MKNLDWRDALRAIPDESLAPSPQDEDKVQEEKSPEQKLPQLKIQVEKRPGGKKATIVFGFEPGDSRAVELAAVLKRKLAVGGSERDGEILLQGDRREQVVEVLRSLGYKVK